MDGLTANMPLVAFMLIGTIAVASAILVVAMRNPVHSALFLLLTFLCVAALFVMKGAEFVGAVQVLVYAGGIMVLFLFAVMLINHRHLPTERMTTGAWVGGVAVGVGIFVVFATIVRSGDYATEVNRPKALRTVTTHTVEWVKRPDGSTKKRRVAQHTVVGNSEAVGTALYTDYLVPFEVASLFLLVAMVGAIVIGKRELSSLEEETSPDYMLKRAEDEREMKEAMGA